MDKEQFKIIAKEKGFRMFKGSMGLNPQFKKYIDNHEDLKKLFEILPGESFQERMYLLFNPSITKPVCKTCKKPIPFNTYGKGYRTFCTNKLCRSKNPLYLEKLQGHTRSREAEAKRKATCIKRYGVDNPAKVPRHAIKWTKSKWKTTFKRYSKLWESNSIKPLFSLEEFKGVVTKEHKRIHYSFECTVCGEKIRSSLNHDKATLDGEHVPICKVCHPSLVGTSLQEMEFARFLDEEDIEYEQGNTTLITPYGIDFFIPSLNLAIEFNGDYFHSEMKGKDKGYHLNKLEMCEKKGIRLIHILGSEWEGKRAIVKSVVRVALSRTIHVVYGRKTELRVISAKEARDFLNANHLQGFNSGSAYLALTNEAGIASCMVLGKSRFHKDSTMEIIRYANVLNTAVVGGFSKLLSYYKNNYPKRPLISYADRRFFTGGIYQKNGFIFIRNSEPNYFYFKNHKKYSRQKFQKHKLEKQLKFFDKNLTEWENMKANKYNRVWDCGNSVWLLDQ